MLASLERLELYHIEISRLEFQVAGRASDESNGTVTIPVEASRCPYFLDVLATGQDANLLPVSLRPN